MWGLFALTGLKSNLRYLEPEAVPVVGQARVLTLPVLQERHRCGKLFGSIFAHPRTTWRPHKRLFRDGQTSRQLSCMHKSEKGRMNFSIWLATWCRGYVEHFEQRGHIVMLREKCEIRFCWCSHFLACSLQTSCAITFSSKVAIPG